MENGAEVDVELCFLRDAHCDGQSSPRVRHPTQLLGFEEIQHPCARELLDRLMSESLPVRAAAEAGYPGTHKHDQLAVLGGILNRSGWDVRHLLFQARAPFIDIGSAIFQSNPVLLPG